MSPAPTIKCPHCLEPIDLGQHLKEASWRELMLTLGGFGANWHLAYEYLLLFRAAPGRAPLKAMKTAAAELLDVWRSGRLSFDRQQEALDQGLLLAALKRLTDKPPKEFPGFKNNHYLWRVAIDLAGQAHRRSSRQEGRAERAAEDARKHQAGARPKSSPKKLAPQPAAAEKSITELPLATQAQMLANLIRVGADSQMDWTPKVEAKLQAAGVDMVRFRSLAQAVKQVDGTELIRRSRAGATAPVQAGMCLPAQAQGKELEPQQFMNLTAKVRRYCRITRRINQSEPAGISRDDLAELEIRLSTAGVDLKDLLGLIKKDRDRQLPDLDLMGLWNIKPREDNHAPH